MRNLALVMTFLFYGINLIAQKGKVELFEVEKYKVLNHFEKLDLNKKIFHKALINPDKDRIIVFISNNQVFLDNYMVEGCEFSGGVAIYDMDFVLKIEMEVKVPEDFVDHFKDFNYEDGKTTVKLFYRDNIGYVENEIMVVDGFVETRRKNETDVVYDFALLLNRFFSVKSWFRMKQPLEENITLN